MAEFLLVKKEKEHIMEKKENIRDLLGISQMDMAMLLKINRGQWSMYESGKRDLPLHATLLLQKMLVYMQSQEQKDTEKMPHVAPQKDKWRKELEFAFKDNQFRIKLGAHKIAAAERKYANAVKALYLVSYLTTQTEQEVYLIKSIEYRATKSIEKYGLHRLSKLRNQQELLEKEETVLKAAIEKLV